MFSLNHSFHGCGCNFDKIVLQCKKGMGADSLYIYIFRFIENKTENKQQIPSFVAAFQGIGQLFAALVVGMARNPSMKEDLFTCGPEDKTSVKAGSLSYISQ